MIEKWVPIVQELCARGVDPVVQVYALSGYEIAVGAGEMIIGRYQRAMETVAQVTKRPLVELQKDVVSRAATIESSESLLAELRAVRPLLESLPGVTSVGKLWPQDARHLTVSARGFATTWGIPLTTTSAAQPEWVTILRELRDRGEHDPLVLLFVTHRCRPRLASGAAIEPMDEDGRYQTLGAALERDPTELKRELFLRMMNVGSQVSPNPITEARQARTRALNLPGVAALEEVPSAPVHEQPPPPRAGKPPPAPWESFPEPPSSMRWRMGAGEDVMDAWVPFWRSMDLAAREHYLTQHPPPDGWGAWLSQAEDR
jgi:hypothetical protein